jgi:hypothetical protein
MVLLSPVRGRALLIVAVLWTRDAERATRDNQRETNGAVAGATTNPRQLRAMQVLDRRKAGVPPRVRFEWDPVAGARSYMLTGRWTSPPSWAIRSEAHRVTAQNATAWEPRRVALEVSLPEGTHSWSVVALFGPHEHGDFDHPTPVSFDVR